MKDWSGHKFNRLTAISYIPIRKIDGTSKWLCLCECGNKVEVITGQLVSGHTKSCGCLQKEATSLAQTTHGQSSKNTTTEYNIWLGMKQRCSNPNHPAFKYYGGRGITVCDRWKESFEYFLEDMGQRPLDKSLERVDNNKGYCKENCKWATGIEQASNKRNNVYIEKDGQRLTLSEWGRRLSIPLKVLSKRHRRGNPPEEILAEYPKKKLFYKNKTQTI